MKGLYERMAEVGEVLDDSISDVPSMGLEPSRGVFRPSRGWPLVRYLVRRIVEGVLMLWVATLLVFFATQGLPGDTARAILGQNATDEMVHQMRDELGLNRPVLVQYVNWLTGLLQGELGNSLANRLPVSTYLAPRIANTTVLALFAFLISVPFGVLVGIVCAARQGGLLDRVVLGVGLVLKAVPEFVIGLGLVFLFAGAVFRWLPPVSLVNPAMSIWNQLPMVLLPAIALAAGIFPYIALMIRTNMIEALDTQYVTQARLIGVPEHAVIFRHALPNVLAPTAQVIAQQVGRLAAGAVAVETVFSYPGMGLSLFGAITYRDLPIVQVLTVFIVIVFISANIVADVVGILGTPRLRTGLK